MRTRRSISLQGNVVMGLAFVVLVVVLGTTAAIEVALLSEAVQEAEGIGCQPGGIGFNASIYA
ncbi:MAG: hypothetical protein ACRD8Z_20980 [Nitrososphaeraceae archaeon]